ncbi:MAG: DegT/DnrJ/EryC1/StrS family aminotransferase, partial [Gammaproteobacteria bacterium]
ENVLHAYHLYTLKINFEALGKSRRQVMKELSERGIGTQVLYIPLHFQPYYKQKYGYQLGNFPNAEQYYSECLSIPMFAGLTDQEVRYISENVIEILEQA